MNPTNPEAARLVKRIEDMDAETRVFREQLYAIQAVCTHQFPVKYDRHGNWCVHCNKYFTAMQQIEEEMARATPAVEVDDDLEDFDEDFDEDDDFEDEDDASNEVIV